ncbi:hybrid sensor histidine kinase/response regulator [Stenomitos frigidus ULC18]|uniref:histidine kinase n=2 Tax=Stenomitos TaxID=1844270 RepID=A0A2T1DYU6_9CYAN|nr:hybrid sensor histidine kinase/response regulator [Stenomitos frigidus ULC18]
MRLTILLVEDNSADADLLIESLSTDSFSKAWQFIHVERLGKALQCLEQQSVDVVLLDLSLPDSHGLDGITQMQTVAPYVPIVVLTGRDDTEMAIQAVAKGAQDYLVKGQISTQLLTRAIRYAIERTQIFKQLKASECRFRAVFDQTFQFMVLLSPDGIVLELNQALANVEASRLDALLHSPIWETERWGYAEPIQQWMKNAIAAAAQGQIVRDEIQVLSTQGELRWLDFSLKPLKDETNKVVLLIAESRDISDRKLIEAKMLQTLEQQQALNQLKSDFVAMSSHEFRTPLTTIRMATELLEKYSHKLTEAKRAQHFERIYAAIASMLHLLDEVLLLGKVDAGGLHYEPAPLELTTYCHDLIETLQLTTKSNHKIIFHCSDEPIQGEMDQSLIHHMLTNLLSNAIKYSPDQGAVWLDVNCQSDCVKFQIKDEGMGIPLQDQQHLFETFYRANNVGKIQGTGLGLAIVKKCVELHQGQIQLSSDVGIGTTVTIMLPRFCAATSS